MTLNGDINKATFRRYCLLQLVKQTTLSAIKPAMVAFVILVKRDRPELFSLIVEGEMAFQGDSIICANELSLFKVIP